MDNTENMKNESSGVVQQKAKEKSKRRTSIKIKMLCTILPVIIVGFIILTLVCVSSMKSESAELTALAQVNALDSSAMRMRKDLEQIRMSAIDLANIYGKNFEKLELSDFLLSVSGMIQHDDMVNGCGLWFEPYIYDKTQEYYGPYWYNDNGEVVETWDYSNGDYDYFNEEYYTAVKDMTVIDAHFTDPYYDPTSGTVMASCSAPMLKDKVFRGVVTVDVDLSALETFVNELQIGKEGYALMTTSSGKFIVNPK